jgi:isoleucyl-tRNA synthetase
MKGFNVLYPQGWDAHGFPTEIAVEKKYGREYAFKRGILQKVRCRSLSRAI